MLENHLFCNHHYHWRRIAARHVALPRNSPCKCKYDRSRQRYIVVDVGVDVADNAAVGGAAVGLMLTNMSRK